MWQNNAMPSLWQIPLLFGLMLILIGVLIIAFPVLINYAVATMFIFAGVSMLGVAWSSRTRSRVQRVDDDWVVEDGMQTRIED